MAKEIINVSITPKEVIGVINRKLSDEEVDRTSFDLGMGSTLK